MSYAKMDIDTGRLIFPPAMLENVPLTFPAEEPDGEPTEGLYSVGYDPAVEPRPDVVADLLGAGYLPVVESQRPENGDGYYYVDGYEIGHDDTTDTDEIVQVWERREVEPPDPNPEISAERALNIILTGVDNDET